MAYGVHGKAVFDVVCRNFGDSQSGVVDFSQRIRTEGNNLATNAIDKERTKIEYPWKQCLADFNSIESGIGPKSNWKSSRNMLVLIQQF
jgi:hypothetical protein